MDLSIVFLVLTILAVVWYAATSIMIYDYLVKKQFKVNFILIRFLIPMYANQYRKITIAETGKTGKLFYHWIISINIALLFAVSAFISKIVM